MSRDCWVITDPAVFTALQKLGIPYEHTRNDWYDVHPILDVPLNEETEVAGICFISQGVRLYIKGSPSQLHDREEVEKRWAATEEKRKRETL